MAFNYTDLEEKQYLIDMTEEVNRIGNYIKETENNGEVPTIISPDFDNILVKINETGLYYVTKSEHQPEGESWNGFVYLEKRNNNYYKIYYTPFNTSNLYTRTYSNGSLSEWEKFVFEKDLNGYQKYSFTNEQGQYATDNDIDIRDLNNSTIAYVKNLVDPPKPELNEGWLDFKAHEDGTTSKSTFNPINSTSEFTKIQKREKEVQNPNLLEDTMFSEYSYPNYGNNRGTYNYAWETNYEQSEAVMSITYDKGYNNLPMLRVEDSYGTHPMFRHKPFEIGKDVQPGDKLTLSAYVMTYDKSLLKENNMYLDVAKYDDYPDIANPNIGLSMVYKEDLVDGQWKMVTNTVTVPNDSKYIAPMLRLNTSESGNRNGFVGYYTLPKLERGTQATPFITHVDDKIQFDEIYTNWLEKEDLVASRNNYTSDILYDNYFKYAWFKDEEGTRTLKDLLVTLPQGFHTFYAQGGIDGVPRGRSIRGTAQVDFSDGDITADTKFINVNFNDSNGLGYALYYNGVGHRWSPLRNHEMATYLWDGSFDLGATDSTIELNDDYRNYEYLELLYWTVDSGHEKTVKIRTETTNTFYIRDTNVGNSATGTGFTAFEGYFRIDDSKPKIAVAEFMKEIGVPTQTVYNYNNSGRMLIKRITGINTL